MLSNIFIEMGLYLGITLVMLLLLNARRNKNNLLLAGALFSMWYVLLVTNLIYNNSILQFPHLYRTGLGFTFLTGPLLFLYARNCFNPGKLFRKWDAAIFIPTVLYFIDLSPFLLSSSANKLAHLEQIAAQPNGIFNLQESVLLPGSFYYGIVLCWLNIFYFLQVRLLVKNRTKFFRKSPFQNKALYLFLATLTGLCLPVLFPGNIGIIAHVSWFSIDMASMSLAVALNAACVALVLRPSILYNLVPKPEAPQVESIAVTRPEEQLSERMVAMPGKPDEQEPSALKKEMPFPLEKAEELDLKISSHLKNTRAYTQSGYSINDLSKETGIPVYQISPLLNNYYNNNFNNWINSFRVHYFLELAGKEGSRKLTQEALANQSGFSNRVTFNKAFRKQMGVTPGEYLKRVKELNTVPGINRVENRA